ncbi:MAG: hypothetical protein LJE91_02625 [Gammaproteobacteria bacterium]|jgi:hypothetical protein|nr:hypothetical protein [Gammaproteobacteria bacterium]
MDNREKQRAFRERQRTAGFTSITEWVPNDAVYLFKALAAALRGEKPAPEAERQFEPITDGEHERRMRALAKELGLKFHQQKVTKGHRSLMGRNGTLWVGANTKGFDICLSGQSLIAEMTPFMRKLTGSDATSSKQPNDSAPFWRVQDWNLVRSAAKFYAQTRS